MTIFDTGADLGRGQPAILPKAVRLALGLRPEEKVYPLTLAHMQRMTALTAGIDDDPDQIITGWVAL
ncbi:hypothetical protein [Ferrovibrio sp.]|uniref:hypothetical protein n=1 Tax=Ferrovibrio sp. TaxID=1917215 RepID=UPI001B5FC96D|nr:hypothetical protein [Ferrovibrio sp.]MBP7065345.1 hypothetical protein [Ferrovibrio sp.]